MMRDPISCIFHILSLGDGDTQIQFEGIDTPRARDDCRGWESYDTRGAARIAQVNPVRYFYALQYRYSSDNHDEFHQMNLFIFNSMEVVRARSKSPEIPRAIVICDYGQFHMSHIYTAAGKFFGFVDNCEIGTALCSNVVELKMSHHDLLAVYCTPLHCDNLLTHTGLQGWNGLPN